MKSSLKKAVEILKRGGIVIFPTDTAYGIGCRMDDEKAVRRLFKIRRRPKTQAVPVLVSSIKMAEQYLQPLSAEVKNLMNKYWPGGLTIVYPCKVKKVPPLVRGGGETLGVRIPNHETPLYIINKVEVPIIGTSANFHGGSTPYTFKNLNPDLINQVDFVVKGKCSKAKASTVIDCSKKPWRILRQGAVKLKPE